MYQRRARTVYRPPSFLEAFLSSAGAGITQGMQRYFREKERKRGMTQNIMERILSGQMPPEIAGTDIFQKYTEAGGISEKPEIKALKYSALETYRPPAEKKELLGGAVVTVPREISPELMKAGLPFEAYLEQKKVELEQDEEEAEDKALRRKLRELKKTDKAKSRLVRKNLLQNIMAAEVQAKRDGQEIQDMDINWTTGSVSVNYLRDAERKEGKEKKATEALEIYKADRKAYDSNAKTARLRRTKLAVDLAKIKSNVSTTMDLGDVARGLLGSLPTKSTDPKVIFDVLYREANKEIDEYNKREAEDAKRLRLKPDQRVKLKRISPKFDVEAKEAFTAVETRHAMNPPPRKPEPTNEEISREARKLMDSGGLDPATQQPYTEEKAREIALSFLKSI